MIRRYYFALITAKPRTPHPPGEMRGSWAVLGHRSLFPQPGIVLENFIQEKVTELSLDSGTVLVKSFYQVG